MLNTLDKMGHLAMLAGMNFHFEEVVDIELEIAALGRREKVPYIALFCPI